MNLPGLGNMRLFGRQVFTSSRRLDNDLADDDSFYDNGATEGLYSTAACLIFLMVTFNFLFPVNSILPLDRRTVAILGATLVFITHNFFFASKNYVLIDGIDFDVIILLSAIMTINYMLVRQPETIKLVKMIQDTINLKPRTGFWLVGLAAFIMSPFLTNDGVCLLFVAPVMTAFASLPLEEVEDTPEVKANLTFKNITLKRSDALFFMLNIACSSNIGSALTYIGNPQNMIVAADAVSVMPPYMFLGYMMIPSLASWFITSFYLEHCWWKSRVKIDDKNESGKIKTDTDLPSIEEGTSEDNANILHVPLAQGSPEKPNPSVMLHPMSPMKRSIVESQAAKDQSANPLLDDGDNDMYYSDYRLQGPFPFAIVALTVVMVICIFAEVMSIAGVVLSFALIMTVVVVMSSHWTNKQILIDSVSGPQLVPLSREQKIENMNFFFEELFRSIDLNILLIFIGLFVVVDNLDSTGIPRAMWNSIVGKQPFRTTSSVIGISIFVAIASQFVGNVPVIQLAVPNVEPLDAADKRYAWAILSYVATVAGNLTLTGSAANVIVAETVARIPNGPRLDFWGHFHICFYVTLISLGLGMALITMTIHFDNYMSGYET
jgi:Na+/H+ antiporter NhaD/arsenite permease-like protein